MRARPVGRTPRQPRRSAPRWRRRYGIPVRACPVRRTPRRTRYRAPLKRYGYRFPTTV